MADLITTIQKLPETWSLTPVFKKKAIRYGWQTEPKRTVEEMVSAIQRGEMLQNPETGKSHHQRYDGIGLRTGEYSGGLLAVDLDGPTGTKLFQLLSECDEIPQTVSWTSGRPGRMQLLFQVPDEHRERFRQFSKKVLQHNGLDEKDPNYFECHRNEKGKFDEQLEFRYGTMQSVLPPSKHPDTKGYTWVLDPTHAVLPLPQWIIDRVNEHLDKTEEAVQIATPQQPRELPDSLPLFLTWDDLEVVKPPFNIEVPLDRLISKKHQEWVKEGVQKGSGRNDAAVELAIALKGTAEYLEGLGQPYTPIARILFEQFGQLSGMTPDEVASRWEWQGNTNQPFGPSLNGDGTDAAIRRYVWEQQRENRTERWKELKQKNKANFTRGFVPTEPDMTQAELVAAIDLLLDDMPSEDTLALSLADLARRAKLPVAEIKTLYNRKLERLQKEDNVIQVADRLNRLIKYSNALLNLRNYLPDDLARALEQKATSTCVDPVAMLHYLLPACASFIGGRKRLKMNDSGWHEPASIWSILVMSSGRGKSRVIDAICDPITSLQVAANNQYEQAKKQYKKDWQIWNQDPDEANKGDEPEAPIKRKHIFNQVQVETLLRNISKQPKTAGYTWIRDEMAGLFKGMDQYKSGGKGDSLEVLLELWNCGFIDRELSDESKSFTIEKSFLSMMGGLQPKIAPSVFNDPDDASGKKARFLIYVAKTFNARYRTVRCDIGPLLENLYNDLVNIPEGDISMSPAAEKVYEEWYNKLSDRIESGKETEGMEAALAKARGYTGRLALVLHCIWWSFGMVDDLDEISPETMVRACKLMQFYLIQLELLQARTVVELGDNSADTLFQIYELAKRENGLTTADAVRLMPSLTKMAEEKRQNPLNLARDLFQELALVGKGHVEQSGRVVRFVPLEKSDIPGFTEKELALAKVTLELCQKRRESKDANDSVTHSYISQKTRLLGRLAEESGKTTAELAIELFEKMRLHSLGITFNNGTQFAALPNAMYQFEYVERERLQSIKHILELSAPEPDLEPDLPQLLPSESPIMELPEAPEPELIPAGHQPDVQTPDVREPEPVAIAEPDPIPVQAEAKPSRRIIGSSADNPNLLPYERCKDLDSDLAALEAQLTAATTEEEKTRLQAAIKQVKEAIILEFRPKVLGELRKSGKPVPQVGDIVQWKSYGDKRPIYGTFQIIAGMINLTQFEVKPVEGTPGEKWWVDNFQNRAQSFATHWKDMLIVERDGQPFEGDFWFDG